MLILVVILMMMTMMTFVMMMTLTIKLLMTTLVMKEEVEVSAVEETCTTKPVEECKEVMVVEEKAARSEYEEVVKSKVKIQEPISKDPIKKVMERVNKEEEMSFLFEESERESVEVRKKAEVETLNIKNRQRGLLKGKESHGNVIKCEERVFKADPVPPQLPCHLQAVPATGAVAGREAEKWRVVRRRRATRW